MNKFGTKLKTLFGVTLTAAMLFSGCSDSRDEFVITNTNNNPVVTPPVAVNDAFNALGNATVNQAASGVLANDTVNSATISSFDAVGSQGGAIDLNADGSFTYTPALNFKGAETFNYTLLNGFGESTATVTMTSTGLGRFVDNSGANGTGTQASPFNNLADAIAAAQPGDTIYVASGNGTDDGQDAPITLPDGVNLVGEGTGLILAQTIEPAGTKPIIKGPIVCEGNNLIQGFCIDGESTVVNNVVINNAQNVTVSNNTLQNPTNRHIDCSEVSGNIVIDANTLQNPPNVNDDYIYFTNDDSDANITITSNTFTNANNNDIRRLIDVHATTTAMLDVNFSNNIANGTQPDQFDFGFYYRNDGAGDCTLTADGNSLKNFENEAISSIADPGPINGTISGNTLDEIDDEAIYVVGGSGTVNITANMISNCRTGFYGYFITANGIFNISNNSITGSAFDGIYIDWSGFDLDGKIALRNNTVTGSATSSISVSVGDGGDMCCDITGNTVNTDMTFNDTNTGELIVERFGNPMTGDELKTVNTFTAPATVSVPNQDVVDAIAGFCDIQ